MRFAALLACLSLACGPAHEGPPHAIRLVAAAGHTPAQLWVELLRDEFIPAVDARLREAGDVYRIQWRQAYGGSVAKLGGVLDAVEVGIVELGLVAVLFEASRLPLQNVTYMTPFGPDDPELVIRTVLPLHREIPAMARAWEESRVVLLGAMSVESYDLYTREPVQRLEDLRGKKLLAPGPAANWVRGTGAVAVAGDLSTYYNDLQTGVADGVLTIATGAWGSRLYEVAPYRAPVNLGAQFAGGVVMNRDTWQALPPEVQRVFAEVGQFYSALQARAQRRRAQELLAEMAERGLRTTAFPPAERRRWANALPNVPARWAATLEARGLPAEQVLARYLGRLRAAGVELPRDWSAP